MAKTFFDTRDDLYKVVANLNEIKIAYGECVRAFNSIKDSFKESVKLSGGAIQIPPSSGITLPKEVVDMDFLDTIKGIKATKNPILAYEKCYKLIGLLIESRDSMSTKYNKLKERVKINKNKAKTEEDKTSSAMLSKITDSIKVIDNKIGKVLEIMYSVKVGIMKIFIGYEERMVKRFADSRIKCPDGVYNPNEFSNLCDYMSDVNSNVQNTKVGCI